MTQRGQFRMAFDIVQCVIAVSFGWWSIWLGERFHGGIQLDCRSRAKSARGAPVGLHFAILPNIFFVIRTGNYRTAP
jgi:hypothetical protein